MIQNNEQGGNDCMCVVVMDAMVKEKITRRGWSGLDRIESERE